MWTKLVLAGYAIVLVPPLMLVAGMETGHAYMAFVFFVLCSPITRFIFGVYKPREVVVTKMWGFVLNSLPMAWLVVTLLSFADAARLVNAGAVAGWDLLGFGLSLWTVMVFGTFPAHEMLHKRSRTLIRLGAFMSGVAGYPISGTEHVVHHARRGNTALVEWARRDQSVWSFVGKRIPMAIRNAWTATCR